MLIELMILVVIVAILATIAYPSYVNSVIRSNRADAQQTLLQQAQQAERWYVANNSYAGFTGTTAQSPQSGTAVYTIAVTATAPTFVVKATPVATGVNKSDGFMDIDNQGKKRWDRDNSGAILANSSEENWGR